MTLLLILFSACMKDNKKEVEENLEIENTKSGDTQLELNDKLDELDAIPNSSIDESTIITFDINTIPIFDK